MAVGAAAIGCTADPAGEGPGAETRAASAAWQIGWEKRMLGWGAGDGQVGLRPGATDFPAEGPSSVAVGPAGEVIVLDRVNERLIAIGNGGVSCVRAQVPRDAEHVAVGPDGATAAWSPLRATVWVHGRDGSALGDLAVPRVLRDVMRVEMGASHTLYAVTAMQETWSLGSPGAPLDLAATLRTKREGAAFLPDGRGVAARRTADGGGEILVLGPAREGETPRRGEAPRTGVAWSFPIEGPLAAVRVVGTAGRAICARVERVTQQGAQGPIAVEREALCVQAGTGEVLLRREMGRPGLYTMHEDVAVGGDPPVLAIARPGEDGLEIERLALAHEAREAHQVTR